MNKSITCHCNFLYRGGNGYDVSTATGDRYFTYSSNDGIGITTQVFYKSANKKYGGMSLRVLDPDLNNGTSVASIGVGMAELASGNVAVANCPTLPSDADSNFNVYMVNKGYLDNTANSVVHKSGYETMTNRKDFADGIRLKGAYPHIDFLVDHVDTASNRMYIDYWHRDSSDENPSNFLVGNVYKKWSENEWRYEYNMCGYLAKFPKSRSMSFVFSQKFEDDQYAFFFQGPKNGQLSSKVTLLCVSFNDLSIYPETSLDGLVTLGASDRRFSQVWASTGTIQTSDENLKDEIQDIPEAVLRAWGKVKFQQFKFKDAITKKGANARIHMGVIAQRIQEAFKSEGLDAHNYGLFCYDEWEDQYEDIEVIVKPEVKGQVKVIDSQAMYNTIYKEDGTEEQILVSPEKFHMEEQVIEEAVYETQKKLVQPAGSRYSVRYEECLALECAYQRWRLDQLEARLG